MPKRQAPRLDRATIVRTALQIVDSEGLDALTLRRLATASGVQAASLYWHFRDKQEIIAEMAQAMLADISAALPPFSSSSDTWTAWLERMALALRGAMLAHRDGARIVAGANLGRATALAELWERGITVLVEAGFELLPASNIVTTIITYTFGFVIEEQSFPEEATHERHQEGLPSPFPLIGQAMPLRDEAGPDANFLAGVRLITAGATK